MRQHLAPRSLLRCECFLWSQRLIGIAHRMASWRSCKISWCNRAGSGGGGADSGGWLARWTCDYGEGGGGRGKRAACVGLVVRVVASTLEWVVGRDVACGGQEPPRAKKGRRKRKGEGDRVEGSGGGRAGREGETAVGPRKEEVWSVRWRKGKIGARCRRHEVWTQAASISFTVPDQQCYLFCAFASVCLVVVSHIISTGLGRQRQRWRRNMPKRCGARVTKRILQTPAKRITIAMGACPTGTFIGC